jgi:type VI secretion system protein ImpA
MKEQALLLAQRTRDLRVAIALARAGARLDGFAGFATGLALVHGLLERQWDTVHPQLDASDRDDPTMRLNALDPLADADTLIADLRAAPLSGARGSITVRQVELAFGKVDAIAGESAVSEAGALQGLADAAQQTTGLLDAMLAVHAQVRAIETLVGAKVGAARAPDLKVLRHVTEALAKAAQAARGEAVASGDGGSADGAAASPARRGDNGSGGVPGAIGSRDDALQALDRVCDWIERHEPTNPAPLLIRRAKRLMTKNFMDIIRDLAPDGLSQVERIAGVENE